MPSISICIATFERERLLETSLWTLSTQTRPPDEIVISDASLSSNTRKVVDAFAEHNPKLRVIYIKSERKALPWQRWWAFQHCTGDIIFYIDDDVRLIPTALHELENAYLSVSGKVAGIGFIMVYENGETLRRDRRAFKERWLGTENYLSGTITPGGLTVSFGSLPNQPLVTAGWLWGGAMSYPRAILEQIGCLDNLITLYDRDYGRSEDAVLSYEAGKFGELYYINKNLVLHPKLRSGPAPYASQGWNLGVTSTFGRFHVLKWLAESKRAFWLATLRLACLEIMRAAVGVVQRPHEACSWARFVGTVYGIVLWYISKIPERPGRS